MSRACAVLVNYKGAEDTAAAVASVRADSPGVEVVVVDNSVDAAEAQRLRAALPADVKLMVAPANLGFGAGCNLAVAATTAEYIWLVNPDVRVLSGCLAALVQALDAHPTLAATAPRQYLDVRRRWLLSPSWLPTDMDSWAREKASRNLATFGRFAQASRAEAVRLWQAQPGQLVPQRALSGGVMLVRRASLARSEPMFDPAYFMYFEDSDLCLRLRRRGWRMAVVPAAEVVHLWQLAPHKEALMAQAAPIYFHKHFAHSRWLQKAAAMAAAPLAWPPCVDVPAGQALAVPAQWQRGWVLELGLNPLMAPAVAKLGTGATCEWPVDALGVLGGLNAPVYARLGPLHDKAAESACVRMKLAVEAKAG